MKQESIPVGYIPPACQLHMFQRPPLDVSAGVGPQVYKFEKVSSDDPYVSIGGRVGAQV